MEPQREAQVCGKAGSQEERTGVPRRRESSIHCRCKRTHQDGGASFHPMSFISISVLLLLAILAKSQAASLSEHSSRRAKRSLDCDTRRETQGLKPCSRFGRCLFSAGFTTLCECGSGYTGNGTHCEVIVCSRPSYPVKPMNGLVLDPESLTVYQPPQDAKIGCESGYLLQGSEFVRCGWFGHWAKPYPTCIDRDECSDGSHRCVTVHADGSVDAHSPGVTCVNTQGSYTCECRLGFKAVNESACEEVTCRANEAVPNGQSFYRGRRVGDQRYVECDEGYSLSTDQQSICLPSGNWSTVICEDKDECLEGSHDCSSSQVCVNSPGSFMCKNNTVPLTTTVPTLHTRIEPTTTEATVNTSSKASPPQPCHQNWAAKVGSLWALVLGLAVIGAFLLGMLAMHTILRKRPETDYAIPSPLRHRELPIVPNNKSRSSMVHLPTAIAHAVVNSTQQTSSTMTLDKNIDAEEHKSNLYVF